LHITFADAFKPGSLMHHVCLNVSVKHNMRATSNRSGRLTTSSGMGPAEALPSGVAATGVPCTHESPALQAQAGQLGPLPALPTLRLSQMQKQVLLHGRTSGHNQCSCSSSCMLMLMFTLICTSPTFYFGVHAHVTYPLCSRLDGQVHVGVSSELRLWRLQ